MYIYRWLQNMGLDTSSKKITCLHTSLNIADDFRVARTRMTRYAGLFVPSAISIFNQKTGRKK